MLHIKAPSVSSATDTTLYIYYDSAQSDNTTYVGDTGDAVAQNVWDNNFVGVYHLGQDPSGSAPQMIDSSSNSNDLTSGGTMTSGDLVDSHPGKGIDFDGSDDQLTISSAIFSAYPCTMEVAGPANVTAGITSPSCSLSNSGSATQLLTLHINAGYARSMCTSAYPNQGSTLLVDGEFCHLASVFTNATDRNVFTNGADKTQDTDSQTFPTGMNRTSIGAVQDSSPGYWAGETSEVRYSDIARSDAWIKATYHSLFDTLITYGSSESPSESASLSPSASESPSEGA